jgi:xanthine dehydrogenase molybdenum-binding subunit
MRGYGNPEATWPIESSLDELAEQAGIDPLEIRKLNCNQPGEFTPMGLQISTCGLEQCLDATASRLGWEKKRGRNKRRGVGMASLIHVGGGGKIYRSDGTGIILKLDDYGTINVNHGGVEMGQGLHSALTLTIAEALGVKPESVIINQTDTSTCPWDVGTHASRGAFMACNAALIACRNLREEIFDRAVDLYPSLVGKNIKERMRTEVGSEPRTFDLSALSRDRFDLRDGQLFVKGTPGESWPKVELARLLRAVHFPKEGVAGTVFTQHAFYEPQTQLPDWGKGYGNMSATYTYGTQGVEVEVDEETGEVRILKLVFALDVGRVLNPQTLKGQMYGGIAQGIGYALYEEVRTENGRIQNAGFTDYKLPGAAEISFPIELECIETKDPSGPFGAKGVGEPGTVPTAPAIGNAIYDAVGVRIRDLPITPEKVLKALKVLKAGKAAPSER